MDSERFICQICGTRLPLEAQRCFKCNARFPGAPGQADAFNPAPAERSSTLVPTLLWLGGILFVLFVTVLVASTYAPAFVAMKQKAKSAESKSSLHDIQLTVEQYAADHDGAFPAYLIGGEASCSMKVTVTDEGSSFEEVVNCILPEVSDPLLRLGYLTTYPVNPFIIKPGSIHTVQEDLRQGLSKDDPLRNASPTGRRLGTRFGADCTVMGQVLADVRYAQYSIASDSPWARDLTNSYSDVQYPFWDMWVGEKPKPYLPGYFFYKSAGESKTSEGETFASEPFIPDESTYYVMGSYGAVRVKGQDVLGDETAQRVYTRKSGGGTDELEFWQWTRSTVSNDHEKRGGSPFRPGNLSAHEEYVLHGNPNGIPDSIVMLLHSTP